MTTSPAAPTAAAPASASVPPATTIDAAIAAQPAAPPAFRNPGAGFLLGLGAANVAMMGALLSVGILTLPLQAAAIDAGTATTIVSIASGVAGVFALIGHPAFGRMSDRTTSRFGRRRPYLLLGALLLAVGALVVLAAASTLVLTVGWVVMTLGQTSAAAALGATIPDQLAPERRGPASALFGVAGTVGAVVGLFLASLVSGSLAAMILLPAGLAVLCLVVFAVVLDDDRLDRAHRPALDLAEIRGTFWVSPRRYPSFALAFGSRFFVFCSVAAVNAYQAIYLIMALHVDPAEVAGKVFVSTLVLAAVSLVFATAMGRLSDKVGRRKPFVIVSALIFAGGLALVAVASDYTAFLVAMAVLGVGQGVYFAVDFALITQVLPDPNNPAKDLGIMNLGMSLPSILVPAVAPALLAIGTTAAVPQNFGSLFFAGAVAGILGAILIVPIRQVR